MRRGARDWMLVVGCVAPAALGCSSGAPAEPAQARPTEEAAAADDTAADDTAADDTAAGDEGAGETAPAEPPEGAASGNIDGAPFSVRGVLAKRLAREKIEVRLFDRPVSCGRFDTDYTLGEDEKVIVVILEWPKEAGNTIALGASNTDDFFQFCHGRASGRASCTPRAPRQGSLSVVAAREDGGQLSFEVASPKGALSGSTEFTLCR